jgi:hypothetical protein
MMSSLTLHQANKSTFCNVRDVLNRNDIIRRELSIGKAPVFIIINGMNV